MHFEKDDNRRNRAGCDDERDDKIRERRRDRNYFDIWFVNLRGIQIGRWFIPFSRAEINVNTVTAMRNDSGRKHNAEYRVWNKSKLLRVE